MAGHSRRAVLGGLAAAPLLARGVWAQDGAAPADLPLRAGRLEHLGTVVPDVAAAATFHSRVFNPEIRKEEAGPLRAYVDLNGAYLAFGARQGADAAFFDHFCVTVADYDSAAVAARLRAEGIDVADNWDLFGLFQDPDGIGVQLVDAPGGWFPTVVDAEPMVAGPPLVTPRALDHVLLDVADIGASVDFYRTYLGPEAGAAGDADGTVRFALGDTALMVRPAAIGAAPGIARVGVKTAPFDAAAVGSELLALGAQVQDADVAGLRFIDPMGLRLELVPQ